MSPGYYIMDLGAWILADYGFGQESVVTDADGNTATGYLSILPSEYYIVRGNDGSIQTYMEFFIDNVRTFDLVWEHGGSTYHVTLDL